MNKSIRIVSLVLTIVISLYLVYNFVSNYLLKNEDISNENSDIIETTQTEDNIEYGAKEIEFDGYRFNIDDDCFFKINEEDETLTVFNNVEKWGGTVRLIKIDDFPENIYDDIDSLEVYLLSKNNDVKNKNVMEIDQKKIFTFYYSYDGHNSVLGYIPMHDNIIYQLFVNDESEIFNYDAFKEIVDILVSGEKIEE